MEPEGSLPCSKETSTNPQPEPEESSQYHPILPKVNFNIIPHLCLGLPSGLFPSGFPNKTAYAFTFSLMSITYPAHLILLDLSILIILGEE
jgi:hypothetical protein